MEKSKYYKIGVLDGSYNLIHEYVTREPMYKLKVLDDISSLIKKVHGQDSLLVWGSYRGDLPNDIDTITREHKDEPLKYNK